MPKSIHPTFAGKFIKNGITRNIEKRYSRTFVEDKDMARVDSGSRADMSAKERQMTISNTGQLNREPWAGTAEK